MPHPSMHRKLYEYVEEEIGLRIVKGLYFPRETLPNEDALCREFGVSRGVIREAIKVLGKKGLVLPRPKIGTRIQPRSSWNLFDGDVLVWKLKAGQQIEFLEQVTEVRSVIESQAVKLAARRASLAEVAAIERHYQHLAAVLSAESVYDYERYLQADMAFHSAILEASHNELLAQIGSTIRHAVQTARRADIQKLEVLLESLPLHAAMARAIAGHDPQAAQDACRNMFDQVWQSIPRPEAS